MLLMWVPCLRCVFCDSLFAAQELRAFDTWSVRSATVPVCKVTVCGSHVKRGKTVSLDWSAFVWLLIDSIPSVRRWLSRALSHCFESEHVTLAIGQSWRSVAYDPLCSAREMRAVEAWLVSSGADSVVLCSVGSISFQLQYMMMFIVSSFITPKLSTLKTWLVRSAMDCKVTVDRHHTKRVVTRDAGSLVLVALSLPGMRKVWQPETQLLFWYVLSSRVVWAPGGTLMRSLYNSLFTASERNTSKSWSDRSTKESDCKITDIGTCAKRVVTRGDGKVIHSPACYWEWHPLVTIQQRTVGQFVDIPVPQVVEELVASSQVSSLDRDQLRFEVQPIENSAEVGVVEFCRCLSFFIQFESDF